MRIITLLITLFAFGITPLQAFSYFSFKKYQVEDGLSRLDGISFAFKITANGFNNILLSSFKYRLTLSE